MRNSALLPAIVVSITLAASQAAALKPVSNSSGASKAPKPTTQTPPFKSSPAPANPSHTFVVNDEKGLLLTCIAPEIDTNPDTDVFNGCSLAAGRTLDEVMHSFIGAIHLEQSQHLKEHSEWTKELDEKLAQKPVQK
jgi:hypothetical protein